MIFAVGLAVQIHEIEALQHTATHRNTLQYTATHRNTLQLIATHCNTQSPDLCVLTELALYSLSDLLYKYNTKLKLEQTLSFAKDVAKGVKYLHALRPVCVCVCVCALQHTTTPCNGLHHTATCCNMLQQAATRCKLSFAKDVAKGVNHLHATRLVCLCVCVCAGV